MRLRMMLHTLDDHLKGAKAPRQDKNLPDRSLGVITSGLDEVKRHVTMLSVLPALKDAANAVLNTELLNAEYGSRQVQVPADVYQDYENKAAQLQSIGGLLRSALQAALPPEDPDAISVEIPAGGSFGDTVAILSNLNDLLTRVGANDAVTMEVQGFDSGSLHLDIKGWLRDSPTAFAGRVMLLVLVAAHLVETKNDIMESAMRLEAMGLAVADAKDASKLNDAVRSKARTLVEDSMNSDGGVPLDPEQLTKLTQVSIELSNVIQEGVKLFPSPKAPPEVKRIQEYPKLRPELAKHFLTETAKPIE